MTRAEPLVDDWRNRGTCRNFEPEAWFPDSKSARSLDARETCASCPVREQCAQFAADTESAGIWAGFHLPHERDKLNRYLDMARAGRVSAEPEQRPVEHCQECGCEMYRRRDRAHRRPGQRVYGGHGKCGNCYQNWLRGTEPSERIDPEPTVSHLEGLLSTEMSLRSIAIEAGLSPRTVQRVWSRRNDGGKIHRETAERLRSVKVSTEVAS